MNDGEPACKDAVQDDALWTFGAELARKEGFARVSEVAALLAAWRHDLQAGQDQPKSKEAMSPE
ncbi:MULTISPECIES: hypothetical protein [Herbaspirillum]|uniref:Uncharacterized protein n=1 Tax=Herbaspirillum frisingense TaxID=92645 RepID=A0ABU1PK66_9BURK|nr:MULTISPECIES: hypothetical protein [Herbaspirillum]MDR6585872.1 hypothetical protein [Herbaspirillum frisingense]QNB06555.1 hypothetical protein G5S34_07095 [Herbaspirillum frisingense]